MTQVEEWKPIPGFAHYEASDCGQVRSVSRNVYCNRGNGFTSSKQGKILSQYVTAKGYLSCTIHTNAGKGRYIHVHRCIALAFHPNPENKPTVNHIDGNKFNNSSNNVAWATYKEQRDHAVALGLHSGKVPMGRGDTHSESAKLKMSQSAKARVKRNGYVIFNQHNPTTNDTND